jgi:hypothetical protein
MKKRFRTSGPFAEALEALRLLALVWPTLASVVVI